MINVSDITIGVVFSSKRDDYVNQFFRSCLSNDKILSTPELKFLVINNACTFDLKQKCFDAYEFTMNFMKVPDYNLDNNFNKKFTFIENDHIESLSYNHNLIYFNSQTNYVIHTNDETYFRKNWLTKTLEWINTNNNEEKIAHLSRCTKGYKKSTIPKMGYFNLLLSGKDGSDSDIEYREIYYLENNKILVEEFKNRNDEFVHSKMIGGFWKQEFFAPLGCSAWLSEICAQPADPNYKLGDSNVWLLNDPNLSEINKINSNPEKNWSYIGKQGLEDISHMFLKISKKN